MRKRVFRFMPWLGVWGRKEKKRKYQQGEKEKQKKESIGSLKKEKKIISSFLDWKQRRKEKKKILQSSFTITPLKKTQ